MKTTIGGKRWARFAGLAAALALVVTLERPVEPAKAPKPNLVAQQLMSAVTSIQRWSEFIYGIRPPGPQLCEPQIGDPVEDPDTGIITQVLRLADCRRMVLTVRPDSSTRLDVFHPDGFAEHVDVFATHFHPADGKTIDQFTVRHVFSNGDQADYVQDIDLVEAFGLLTPVGEHFVGRLKLRGREVPFRLDRQSDFENPPMDRLEVELPGMLVELEIPITFPIGPDFYLDATGEVRTQGKALPFLLRATRPNEDPRWDRMIVGPPTGERPPGVSNGTFRLEPDFSGRGQMYRGRKLDFVAHWDRKAAALIVLPNGGVTSAGPAPGLLDLAFLRWSGLISGNAPAPM